VLDLTAIATLCMLGRLSLLRPAAPVFVISQSTLAELRRLALTRYAAPAAAGIFRIDKQQR